MSQPTTAIPDDNDLDPQHAPHRPADDREEIYFEGSPLVRGDLPKVALFFLIGAALIAAPLALWVVSKDHASPVPWWGSLALIVIGLLFILIPYLNLKRIRYRISNYRIDYERGLMSKTIDTLELWHVEDIKFHQSFFDRLFGVGTISIVSHDQTTPMLVMRGLPHPRPLFDSLKQRVIAVKRQRGVIKMDVG
jgi:membrane protein YdbS with pleckstrin-like domain